MGRWTRYLLHDFWTAEEFNRIDHELAARRHMEMKGRVQIRDHVKELEGDLARVALFARALADACIRKGLLTHDEITSMIHPADLADGTPDGKLDPKRLGGSRKPQSR
jgi:hypothetical protein